MFDFSSFAEWMNKFVEWYTSLSWVFGMFLAFLENIFPPLPIIAIVGANVASYGLVIGFIISYIGRVSGAALTFSILRKLFYNRFQNKSTKWKRLYKFEKWLSERSFGSLLIVLSLPFAPYSLIHLAASISDISKKKYFLTLILGNFFMILFLSLIGYNFRLFLITKDLGSMIFAISFFIIVYGIGKVIEKRMHL